MDYILIQVYVVATF